MSDSNGKPRTVPRELPVQLTDEEKLKKGLEMAEVEMQIADLVVKRQALNAKILEAGKSRRRLGKEIDDGTELRQVRCTVEEDFTHNVLRYRREDTGEVVDEQAMTAEDRETEIDFGDGDEDEGSPGLQAGESESGEAVEQHSDPARRAPKKPGKGRRGKAKGSHARA